MKPQVSEREMQQVKAVFDAKHALLVDRETELSRSLEAFALEREGGGGGGGRPAR